MGRESRDTHCSRLAAAAVAELTGREWNEYSCSTNQHRWTLTEQVVA